MGPIPVSLCSDIRINSSGTSVDNTSSADGNTWLPIEVIRC